MALDAASLQGVCELLRHVQDAECGTREAAEKRLDAALESSPDALVSHLAAVLAAKDAASMPTELRQEAVVLLRQCVVGTGRRAVWSELSDPTKILFKAQLLATVHQDPSPPVRRGAGSAAAAIAELLGEDSDELQQEWPELLPALSHFVGSDMDSAIRVTALGVFKELAATIGDGLLAQGPSALAMLSACLADAAAEVRAAAVQLALQLVEDMEEEQTAVLGQVMPQVIAAIQSFVGSAAHEDLLKETLEALVSAADEEPGFFKANGAQQLWPMLMQVCSTEYAGEADVKHGAMEAAMSFAVSFAEDLCQAEGQPMLEQILCLNVEWMLDVEEDADAWTKQADADEDDELDAAEVEIGEENLDRLAEKFADEKQLEDTLMPALFKILRLLIQGPGVSWRHVRAAVMAVSQVVEHVEEEAWVDQCVEFVAQHLTHAHPRVRDAGFQAIVELVFDHEPYVQESHHETLLPAIVTALDDTNVRVAASAAQAFASLGDELESDALEPHLDELMTKLFLRLQQGQSRTLQEQCLAGIAVVGSVAEELFVPYYSHVMPVLKELLSKSSGQQERLLRGKGFECASLIGDAVGKETFAADAHEIMKVMVEAVQAGFAPDDPQREYVHEAAGRIAKTLQRDFKPYVASLLPVVLESLKKQLTVDDELRDEGDEDDDKADMSLLLAGEKAMGLKTTALDEMKESLILVKTLIGALEDDFCDNLPLVCQALLPLIEQPLTEEVAQQAFSTWEAVAGCARASADCGKCDRSAVSQLVSGFLKTTVDQMAKAPQGVKLDAQAVSTMQAQAVGVSGVVERAGPGVMQREDVAGLLRILVDLLQRAGEGAAEQTQPAGRRRGRREAKSDSDSETDGDAEEATATRQTLRFCLADIARSLMSSNRTDFAEVALPAYLEFLKGLMQPSASDEDRGLAMYIADDLVDCLGELSVPCWNLFMEPACHAVTDRSPVVRQYACSTMGHAALQPVFSQIAPLAATQLARLLQRHGERHRRRRAATREAKELALSVDAAIRALGLLCEHQERVAGPDAVGAWRLWLSHMPLRYDHEEGQKAHGQLLDLLTRGHPVISAPEQLPRVLAIFADVYRTRFSNGTLDRGMAAALAGAGGASVQGIAAGLPQRQREKVEQMVKDGQGGPSGTTLAA